ncbi:MAG: patatin-like phospholipase family protein [Candidatus Eisenbacteria bacterium]
MSPAPRALHPAFRGKRLAVVLAGGGALGAYEVGVLRVLEALRVRPAILAGVSVGAINAVAWLAHGFRTQPLELMWGTLRGSHIGMHWSLLLLRALGALVAVLGVAEALLSLMSSQELNAVRLFRRSVSAQSDVQTVLLDVMAWLVIATMGFLLLVLSGPADRGLARLSGQMQNGRINRLLGRGLLVAAALHLLTLGFAVPWPHRFSATLILVGAAVWMLTRPGRPGVRARRTLMRLLPETRGRGIWPSAPRRKVIDRLVEDGDARLLLDPDTHLMISACDLQSGRIVHFINWRDPSESFRARLGDVLGEAMPMLQPPDLLRAALASSAIPLLYEPVRIFGRDYVDAGPFSNQPIHVAIADDADAVLVVLLSRSGGMSAWGNDPHLMELGGRLIELASWRELQSELRALPREWTRTADAATGEPARVCVVEPETPLPGSVLTFDPTLASELMDRGEADAWLALERAGWCPPVENAV